ncbi:DUF4136 domain-containing protein [Pedobacter miscanthi]|uniref:DUF4136 domain-containing protein n=1 Tax=Pedobacter miscanthi TaxID=2259170 RepID=A0A366L4K7_9SPHI|nr:DUF4136 domain-containing protein [Pedobacter miscanthi]RBQ08821.1 hypothetical protein DRW42_08940 [Pedobacter miscanthi]
MKHTLKWGMLFTIVMAFTSCITVLTASDYDKKIDFSKLKSFAYFEKGIDRLELNNLDKPRMLEAVESAVLKKGFTKSDRPDFLINVVVLVNTNTRADWGYSGGGYQWDATASSYQWKESQFGPLGTNNQYQNGTIIIDFLNPETKAIMWHGIGSGFNFDDYENREQRINLAVKQILQEYPPYARQEI